MFNFRMEMFSYMLQFYSITLVLSIHQSSHHQIIFYNFCSSNQRIFCLNRIFHLFREKLCKNSIILKRMTEVSFCCIAVLQKQRMKKQKKFVQKHFYQRIKENSLCQSKKQMFVSIHIHSLANAYTYIKDLLFKLEV